MAVGKIVPRKDRVGRKSPGNGRQGGEAARGIQLPEKPREFKLGNAKVGLRERRPCGKLLVEIPRRTISAKPVSSILSRDRYRKLASGIPTTGITWHRLVTEDSAERRN